MKILAIIICFLISNVAFAVIANDECSDAILLGVSTTCVPTAGTLLNASTTSITVDCGGYNDVFYMFVATSSTNTITVVPSSTFDPKLSVFSSWSGPAITCQDVGYAGGSETAALTNLVSGKTYFIKVSNYSTNYSSPTFTICVEGINMVIPPNDNCLNSIPLTPSTLCNHTMGTLLNATNSSIPNSCIGNNDVFYSFNATAATATISVIPSSQLDVAIGVFKSCSGVNISCSDGQITGGTENVFLSNLVMRNTYIIQVKISGVSIPTTLDFSICVISANPSAPINDECADAILIYPSLTYSPIEGTVKRATTSTLTTSCTGNSDVFYKFTAGAKTATITVIGSSGLDPVIGLFNACGTSNIDCADFDYNVGGTEILTPTNLIIGATYYIKVQDYSNTLPSTFTFTIAVQSTPIVTDMDAVTHIKQISLFPNPTQNVLNIENVQTKTSIELVDLRGKVLLSKEIDADSQIDLSEFASGVYILKLSVNGVVDNKRVVLSK